MSLWGMLKLLMECTVEESWLLDERQGAAREDELLRLANRMFGLR